MMNDSLSAALSKINNAGKIGRTTEQIKPVSKVIKKVLEIMNDHGYVGKAKEIQDSKGNALEINLMGKINKCGVIKPRFSLKSKDFEKFEKRYLPAKNFGIIIISTNKGMMTLDEAKKQQVGGKLIAYCY